ncbi:hypothetical protein COO60DRAFT_1459256 [Scenedesmus sp. NREL 46B-D3]|nr:hypothetical protein COO60DRAFT_1459256 [Scenedesmus sp. NREL 46B-D3]
MASWHRGIVARSQGFWGATSDCARESCVVCRVCCGIVERQDAGVLQQAAGAAAGGPTALLNPLSARLAAVPEVRSDRSSEARIALVAVAGSYSWYVVVLYYMASLYKVCPPCYERSVVPVTSSQAAAVLQWMAVHIRSIALSAYLVL